MYKAGNILRRSSVRLKSISEDNTVADLNMIISQITDVKKTFKAFVTAQTALTEDLTRWSVTTENSAIESTFLFLNELSAIWTEVQKEFAGSLKEMKVSFSALLEQQKQLSQFKRVFSDKENEEKKYYKDLKKNYDGMMMNEIENLQDKIARSKRMKEIAHMDVVGQTRENEAVRLIRVKESLKKFGKAYINMNNKGAVLFHGNLKIVNEIPDVNEKQVHNATFNASACASVLKEVKEKLLALPRTSKDIPTPDRNAGATSSSEAPQAGARNRSLTSNNRSTSSSYYASTPTKSGAVALSYPSSAGGVSFPSNAEAISSYISFNDPPPPYCAAFDKFNVSRNSSFDSVDSSFRNASTNSPSASTNLSYESLSPTASNFRPRHDRQAENFRLTPDRQLERSTGKPDLQNPKFGCTDNMYSRKNPNFDGTENLFPRKNPNFDGTDNLFPRKNLTFDGTTSVHPRENPNFDGTNNMYPNINRHGKMSDLSWQSDDLGPDGLPTYGSAISKSNEQFYDVPSSSPFEVNEKFVSNFDSEKNQNLTKGSGIEELNQNPTKERGIEELNQKFETFNSKMISEKNQKSVLPDFDEVLINFEESDSERRSSASSELRKSLSSIPDSEILFGKSDSNISDIDFRFQESDTNIPEFPFHAIKSKKSDFKIESSRSQSVDSESPSRSSDIVSN